MQINRVLMVDDDPSIRKIAEICLSRVGKWQVGLADCGARALEMSVTFQPDVILLDVMMPGMDGPTTIKQLQNNTLTALIPVIFMTAKVQSHEIEKYSKMGAAGVISKPFDPMTLPSEIIEILNRQMTVERFETAVYNKAH
jgi:CheY-like chemotaxis protein